MILWPDLCSHVMYTSWVAGHTHGLHDDYLYGREQTPSNLIFTLFRADVTYKRTFPEPALTLVGSRTPGSWRTLDARIR